MRGDKNTLVTIGGFLHSPAALLTLLGIAVSLVLDGPGACGRRSSGDWRRRWRAVLVTGQVAASGRAGLRPSSTCRDCGSSLLGALRVQYLPLILVLLFFALFDTLGTLMGIAHQAGLLRGGEPSPASAGRSRWTPWGWWGARWFGTSPVTAYIESGWGWGSGRGPGSPAWSPGCCSCSSLFLTPLVGLLRHADAAGLTPVTAPALILVGTLMVRAVQGRSTGRMS